MKPNIYTYRDYRVYLKDMVADLRKNVRGFSLRTFNRKIGIKSSGFLNMVIDGKRNLGNEGLQALAEGFSLSDRQTAYLKLLVQFNHAGTHEEKDQLYQQLVAWGQVSEKKFAKNQYDVLTHWYYVAILELLALSTPKAKTAEWIATHLRPQVGLVQTKAALKVLVSLDLVRIDDNGICWRAEGAISTDDDLKSILLTNFHKQMCLLAAQKVCQANVNQREFGAVTLAMTTDDFTWIKSQLREFRDRLSREIYLRNQGGEPDKTVLAQINLQLFELGHSDDNVVK